jgi:predicted Zn finger-like uncharacterized protein
MSSITNCPNCQTQFVVTEEQLSQFGGKVRCGSCLNVFNATQHMVAPADLIDTTLTSTVANEEEAPTIPDIEPQKEAGRRTREIDAGEFEVDTIQEPSFSFGNTIGDILKFDKPTRRKRAFSSEFLGLICFVLLLAAIVQSIYFLRTEITTFYPETKPYLLLACEKINCTIDLPKQIELIVIDDSDMQEDAEYSGLMRLTSTLINQAGFNQAYPNLELTLTDTEDIPKLRRIFKPNEYLPKNTDIAKGLAASEEIKVKLAITTAGELVAGYRLAVNY